MTDASQAVTDSREYDALGLRIASTGSSPSPFRFAAGVGYQADPDSGLMLVGERFYGAGAGRFVGRDPLRYIGGVSLYGYCSNDPVGCVDPTGRFRWSNGIIIGYEGIVVVPGAAVWADIEIRVGRGGISLVGDAGAGQGVGLGILVRWPLSRRCE
jgi:RHS repeat-associated protein